MTLILVQVLAFVVAIGILIAAHEYGHFWVARRLGFKVLRFSVGFGRPLLRRVGRDGVEYTLGAIPLGGFVKLADEREAPVEAADVERAFNRRPVWQRILVLAAGAGANFLFAIVAFWILFMAGVPGLRPVIGEVKAGSIAANAGLRAGDEIVAVEGHPATTREAAVLGILGELVEDGRVVLQVRRAEGLQPVILDVPPARRRALTEPGAWAGGLGFGFTHPHLPVVVGSVRDGGPAARAGLRAGDEIVAVNGRRVGEFTEFRSEVGARPGETVFLDVRRGASDLRLAVTVAAEREGGVRVGRIGIAPGGVATFPPGMETVERYGPLGALGPALARTWQTTALTLKFLARMVTGDVSLKNVSGPLSIATYAGFSALEGLTSFLTFLAGVSISLGVLNLMPVPILDGGQIVYQCAEAARGRPLPERVQALGQQLGIVLLILLMSLAFYNDIARHLG